MILETKNKVIKLVLKTRKIVDIARKMGCKNFEEGYFKIVKDCDVEALSKTIYTLAEDEEGKQAFKSFEEVYDFIDDYLKECNKSYTDIFNELAEAINEEGFFMKKRTKKELQAAISNPLLNMNMDELVRNSAEKAISTVAEKEFQGFKA